MRTNFVQTCKTSANRINLNRITMRVALIGLFISLGIGNAWGSATYNLQLKTVTQNSTGYGKVYAAETTATPEYSSYYTSNTNAYTAVTASNKTYYLWAIPTQRGVTFDKWTTSSTSSTGCTAGSSTLTDANKMQGAKVTVKAPTSASGTSTYTTTATVTANWNDPYSKVVVTYATPVDGKYRVTYEYSYLNTSTNALETGFTFDMEGSSAARAEDSYYSDIITLQSLDGVFEGWYDGSTLLSTENPYTYVASASGGSVTISAHYTHVDKYYGRLTASIAEVPYSMPGGGTIFIATDPDASGTYSADAQSVSNESYGESQNYYLHAQPNDKRYVFRGWYSDATCTSLISTDADYAYTFTSSSTNSASPTLGNVYAAFDFNLYYMQVEVEPAVPGLGMVLVKDNNTGTPEYTDYTTHAEQFLYAYRLTPTANAYLYAKPKYGYKFSGWYDNPDCTGTAKSTANPYTYAATGTSTDPMNPTITKLYARFIEDATTVNITYNLPDQTKGEYTASVLDIAEVDDDFIWTFTQVFTSEGKTGNTTQAQHKTDVLRLEAQPKAGYGVTSWTIAGAAKTTPSQLYETSGTAAATYGVTFGDAKPFLVCSTTSATTGTAYATLREAIDNLGSNKKIVVVQNAYVPAGNYTIPSGVTLLVPYNADYGVNTTPSTVTSGTPSRSVYVTLTLGDGAIINVNGSICVNTVMCLTMGYNGSAMNGYGLIDMNAGSQIKLNSGANCYVWGFIIGNGTIMAESGAILHETFQFKHRGGTALSSITNSTNSKKKVFPINQYYIQSIEAPITIKKGATEKVYTGVHNTSTPVSIDFIGTSGLFNLTGTDAYLIKRYDVSKDRQEYSLYGNATIGSITFGMYGFSKESKDYVLPITNNMTLNVESGTTTIQYETAILPDVQVSIASGAKVVTSDNCFVYDSLGWKGAYAYACQYSAATQTPQIAPVVYRHGGLQYNRKNYTLRDATIDVIGELSGVLYTTNGGANITSSNSGKVTVSGNRSVTATYQVGQDGSSPTFDAISTTSAQLRNGDGSYVSTAGASSSDQFIYSKPQDKWLKNPKVISWNANGGTTDASTIAYSEGAFVGELPAAYKDGHTLEGWYTAADGGTQIAPSTKVTANVTYYAHWTTKSYSITYRDQGGAAFSGTHVDTPNAHPTTHTFGTATALTGATKEHYTFGGWYRTPSCSGAVVTSIAASECKNITLYAKWIPNTHKLTWDWNGGATSSTTYTAAGDAVAYNTTIVYPAASTMTKTNYVFSDWDKSITTMPDEDLTITAQWTPAVASVTVNSATTYYATIDDAFTAANNATAASTLTLLQDVTVTTKLTYNNSNNKNCTLDLHGYTLTSNTSEQSPLHINNTSITFTITDGTVEKAGKLSLNSSFSTRAIFGVYVQLGTLLLNAGTIEVTSSTANTCGVTADQNGIFTMNGGTIHVKTTNGKEGRGVYLAGSVSINGGTVHVEAAGTAYGIRRENTINSSTITVNDGKFNVIGSTAYVTNQESANSKVVIRGGYYTTNSQLYPTAPYHVFGLDNQSPYLYEVAEGYTLTWTTDGDPLTGTYTSGVTKPGTTIVEPATPTKTGYTFNGWNPAVAAAMPAENTEYTATWTPNTNTAYAVKHYQQNLADDEYTLFETDNLTGTTDAATEAVANSYTGFTAQSFSQSTIAPDGSTTVSIYYNRDKFTITWNNADGSTLETDANVKYGALPAYDGTTPTKTTDAEYAYAFNGWSPAVSAVTADATYTATYTTTPVVASLTVNSSGNKYYYTDFSEAFNIAKNSVPVTITLLRDASCSEALVYNGSNTDCTLDLNGHTLTGTLSAQLILNINKAGSTFTITDGSANHDGKLSFSSESESTSHCVIVNNGTFVLEEGTIEATSSTASIGAVKVAGGTFTMNENGAVHAKYTGNVSGKNSRFVNATGGTTNINGGTIHLESTSDAIGVVYSSGTVTITGGNFKIEAGGTAAVTNQTGANNSLNIRGGYYSANSTGYFQPHVKIPYHIFSNSDETYIYRVAEAYTITFVDGDGNTLLNPATTNNLWKKGETPVYSGATPTKDEDAQYTYTFTGWSPVITTVTEAATYTAQFSSTPRTYTVTLNTNDGTINTGDVTEYTYGTGATLPTDVTKDGHEFGGWFDNDGLTGDAVTTISTTETGNKEYWAKWTASIADRELDIVDWTSNSITINVTNLKAVGGTNKNNWAIRVNGVDYTKSNCNTTTRTLTVSGLSLTPNENLLIQLKNDADVIESQHNYMIPQIYTAENATLSDTNEESVVYVYGGKLTISGDAALAALYVCPGAEVEVNGSLIVGKLVLRTKPWATAAISGNVTATNVYYTRIAPDGSVAYPTGQYYQFGLPYACAISAVRLSDGTTPAYNTTWILKNYDEESRATNGATGENWDVLSSGTIAAGRGYEMFSSYKYYREYYFPVTPTENTSVDVTRHGNDKNNSGWNIVCSPLMNVYRNESNPVDGLKVSWLLPDGSYDQAWPETIWPALPFSYQASATGSLDFSSGDFNQTVSAPRRAAYKEDIQTEWIHLDVKDENGVGDHTSVFVHPDRFESTYQTGIDVAKQSLTASRALIYSSHAYGEMAFAGVADVLLENGVALTVYSPKEQELTISMRKNDWLNRMAFVWLIDQATGAQIDLLDSDYSFNAEAGTTAGRFILMGAFFAPQITTDNGNVQSDDEHIKVTKFIYNDKMYIQINGVIYDATGKLVK